MRISRRKNQDNVWVDKEFKSILERIKAKKILAGEKVDNLGQITEQMIKTPAFKDVEAQLIKNGKLAIEIKMDQRRKKSLF